MNAWLGRTVCLVEPLNAVTVKERVALCKNVAKAHTRAVRAVQSFGNEKRSGYADNNQNRKGRSDNVANRSKLFADAEANERYEGHDK